MTLDGSNFIFVQFHMTLVQYHVLFVQYHFIFCRFQALFGEVRDNIGRRHGLTSIDLPAVELIIPAGRSLDLRDRPDRLKKSFRTGMRSKEQRGPAAGGLDQRLAAVYHHKFACRGGEIGIRTRLKI